MTKNPGTTLLSGTRGGNALEVRICNDGKVRVIVTTETGKEIILRTRWGINATASATEDFESLADAKASEMTEAELRRDQHENTYTMNLKTGEMVRL